MNFPARYADLILRRERAAFIEAERLGDPKNWIVPSFFSVFFDIVTEDLDVINN